MQVFARHTLTARDFFQLLVSPADTVAAHHGLYRFGQHFPGVVQVSLQRSRVELQFVQALQQRLVRQHRIAQRHAHIAQHGAVGQVALPAADGQFVAQVAQQSIGQT